jgi:hypothetical protein
MHRLLIALLFGMAAVGFIYGYDFMARSQSAVHEIEALICFLIGAVGLGCGTVAVTLEAGRQPAKPGAPPAAAGRTPGQS